jgi:hypothetical protein
MVMILLVAVLAALVFLCVAGPGTDIGSGHRR